MAGRGLLLGITLATACMITPVAMADIPTTT
jgi:hypothetical protein